MLVCDTTSFLSLKVEDEEKMAKVKMLVQTKYNDQLLRAEKVYEVPDETAKRWDQSRLAVIVNEQQENKASE